MSMHLTEARLIRLAAAACVASACGGQPRSVVSYEARDSAGVQIHEYDEAAFAAAPRWTVSAAPVLDVGSGLEDDHRYEFFRIEAVDRLSTGELVVLNSGTREIRVYDSAGAHVRDVGRVGTGPGEFVAPRWLEVMEEDSLLVFDFNQHRLTVFDPGGAPARTVPVGPLNLGYNPAVGLLDDRSFLVRTERQESRSPSAAMIAAFKEHDLEVYGDSAMIAGFRRVREAMPYPATTPAFIQLAIDSEQNLWIRQYPTDPESSAIWHIFSPTGRLSGRVELPAAFEPKLFEASVVTGTWTDADNVEHLQSYEVERRNRE